MIADRVKSRLVPRMTRLVRLTSAASLAALLLTGTAMQAHAGATLPIAGDASLTVGLGMRASFTSTQAGAPDGKSSSADFSLDSVRLYISGTLTPYLKATFNTERDSDGKINVLDGYAQFQPADEINLWVGRMLPPSDRANLDGPYYLNTWYYPGVVSQYPAKFDGRDDGATVWGKLFQKKLVYSFGAFQGHNRIAGASNQGDHLLYAGRIAYNFWDAEDDPAYYTSSTYYGAQNILTLAVAGQDQHDGVGTAAHPGDYKAWNVDGLFEKKFGAIGTFTLEGAYYDYDTSGVADVATSFAGAGATANVGGITQGKGYLVGGAYLWPVTVGWGQFQPAARFQRFDNDLTGAATKQLDLGVNYIIKGHNARVSADYKHVTTGSSNDSFVAGVQLQF